MPDTSAPALSNTAHFSRSLIPQNTKRSTCSKLAAPGRRRRWPAACDAADRRRRGRVVVEGTAIRISDRDTLQRLADAFEAKYGSAWHFEVGDGVFGSGEDAAAVFRIEPVKVFAFAKEPHAQTRYRF
jgi:hypothetical protein